MKSAIFTLTLWAAMLSSLTAVSAAAEDQTAGEVKLEEIVVTATRREERLQDVPISITVFDQQQLSERNIVNAGDLAAFTPSLSVDNQFGNDNTSFGLRGFTQTPQTSATVGVFFADVVAPRGGVIARNGDGAGPGMLFDLQNVQVLKGPQGTLFGRNTTGGDVLIVPQKPTSTFGGYVEGSVGDYNMGRVQGVLNIPLSDSIRLRLGGDTQSREGYLTNISGIGPSNFSNINYAAGRVSLVADITSNVENYTIAYYDRSNNHGPGLQLYQCNPASRFAFLSCPNAAAVNAAGPYAVENGLDNPVSLLKQWQVINTTTWQATDNLTIKNIASYGQLRNTSNSELFGDNFNLPGFFGPLAGLHILLTNVVTAPGADLAAQSTLTEELQFQGRALGGKLTWQTGGYLEISSPLEKSGERNASAINCTSLAQLQCFDVLGLLATQQTGAYTVAGQAADSLNTIFFRNLAGYAQATYALTDVLKLTGGVRFTDDTTSSKSYGTSYVFLGPGHNVPTPLCLDGRASSSNGCALPIAQHTSAPTWLVDLDYTPMEDALFYAKYSRGYRQGGIVPIGPQGYDTYRPEHVDAYELGAKTSYRGRVPAVLDIAAFYNDLRDQQLLVSFQNSTTAALVNSIVNAGKARNWGIEVESSIKPFRDLNLEAAYTYLNTRIEQIAAVAPPPGGLYNTVLESFQAGDQLPGAPHHKASLTTTYTLPTGDKLGAISFSTTYNYTDATFISSLPYPSSLPAYGLLNLSANWRSIWGTRLDAQFFMTNVTNKYYVIEQRPIFTILGFNSRRLGEPRMYGMRFRVNF